MKSLHFMLPLMFIAGSLFAREYHVAKTGNDTNQGTLQSPLLTIQAAADKAMPGDTIIVHQGTYREWVVPPRGGESDSKRIIYRAADGEVVEIKGSEIIKDWVKLTGNIWMVSIPVDFFGDFNPYTEVIAGDWFNDMGRDHHRGEVYLNGTSLWESATFENVLNPKTQADESEAVFSALTWFCESDEKMTYIYANFQGADPNKELVEINVRQSCFYPDTTGINFITVKGFRMNQAATQWAPPTAEQIGLIGTNWSKGWIIEDNIISDSKCSGITLGKYGDEWDNTSANAAEGYVETIKRALNNDWSRESIGHHIVRNNIIFNCEQTGICGSMGAVFSTIENNDIFDIYVKRQFRGAEMAGIKIHGSIDMVISNNRLANCGRGLWLDWMAQGTRVIGNLIYGNTSDDLFLEVNHGPCLIENNIFLSELSIRNWSQGGAFVHNLIAGEVRQWPMIRDTPYHFPHSTLVAGLTKPRGGDDRFFNNIFIGAGADSKNRSGMKDYDSTEFPVDIDGNVYLNGAHRYKNEANQLRLDYDPELQLEENEEGVFLFINLDKRIFEMKNITVDSELLGTAMIPGQRFENPDGSSIIINKDYFGKTRKKNPSPGPFETPGSGKLRLKIF